MEPWENEQDFPAVIDRPTESALIDALRQHDELNKLLPKMPKPSCILKVCQPVQKRLRDLCSEELDVFQVVLNTGSFKAVINTSIQTDHEAAETLYRLLRGGYVEAESDDF